MLTPRMPLYIPCVYNVFMYSSTVAAWRLGLPAYASAALAGLMGELIYAPYDITGMAVVQQIGADWSRLDSRLIKVKNIE